MAHIQKIRSPSLSYGPINTIEIFFQIITLVIVGLVLAMMIYTLIRTSRTGQRLQLGSCGAAVELRHQPVLLQLRQKSAAHVRRALRGGNTLIVAVVGCFFTAVIGFTFGVCGCRPTGS